MTTVYVVLIANSFGTADVAGVFTESDPAEQLAIEEGGRAFEAWIEEGQLDQRWDDES